jgi:hypothetical protein
MQTLYSRLKRIKERVRNPFAHGGVENDGGSLLVHIPTIGAMPANFTQIRDRLVPGAVINARLDRILGAKQIKQVLEDAESGQLERLRQSCLYVDVIDGKTLLPEDIITEAQVRFLTVLAGEMWVEILGHFPWEFEEMLAKVIAYEIKIGFSAEMVKQS